MAASGSPSIARIDPVAVSMHSPAAPRLQTTAMGSALRNE
jgi:hypothetical protein